MSTKTDIELDSQDDYDLDIKIANEEFENDSVWISPYE